MRQRALDVKIQCMPEEKLRVLLYLKKSSVGASGEAPLMGRITLGRSVAQFSCKMSCSLELWDARSSRLRGKSQVALRTKKSRTCWLAFIQSIRSFEGEGLGSRHR